MVFDENMKVKMLKRIGKYRTEFVALEDGTIITDCGDHPTFGIKSLEDMRIFIKKGNTFQLRNTYIKKNKFEEKVRV